MRVLLDTHAVLWWLMDDRRLPSSARRIIENPAHSRLFSHASLWETAIKMSSGKLPVRNLKFAEIPALLTRFQFQLLPIRLTDIELLDGLPWHHRDPFDRLLIAQSMAEGIPIMTSDSWVQDYEVQTIW